MAESVLSFEELYQKFSPDVYRFALYLTADRALAEDITSETFVRAWTAPTTIRTATVKAYLLAIARNLYVEDMRRQGRQAQLAESVADRNDLARRTEIRDALGRATAALQRIPEGDRTAFLMRALDEMPYEEIAAALGISVAAVKARIFRSRLRLTHWREALEWKT
jgi:RNA polymerase sigma-70 factor (ECF subfamily)